MSSARVAVVLAFALAVPAFAADVAPATTAPSAKAEPNKAAAKPEDKLICTRETVVGSTIPKRVCKTQAQIDKEREQALHMRDEIKSGNSEVRPQ